MSQEVGLRSKVLLGVGIGLVVSAVVVPAVVIWQLYSDAPPPPVEAPLSPVRLWRGGELNQCFVTVDGAALEEYAGEFNVVMLCGLERTDLERAADRAVTVSDAVAIEPTEFSIEEAVSGPMRVLLEERTTALNLSEAPDPDFRHEEALWYELVLLPKTVDAFDVRSLGDVERLGGRRLLTEPLWSVIAVRP